MNPRGPSGSCAPLHAAPAQALRRRNGITWGERREARSGGMDALLGRETLAGLAANDNGGGDDLENRRLELRLGYGFPAFGERFTSTPEFGLGLSQGRREYSLGWRLGTAGSGPTALEFGLGLGLSQGRREYSLGWRLNLAQTGPTALELRLQATRSESAGSAANDNTAEHGIGFRATARW